MYCKNEKQLKQWEKNPIRFKAEINRLEGELYQEFLRQKNSQSIHTRFKFDTPEWEKAFQGELDFYELWSRVIKMQNAIIRKEIELEEMPKAKIIPIMGKR
jgi:hypothetical protein